MPALTPEHNPSAAHGPPGAADFDALYEARYGDVVDEGGAELLHREVDDPAGLHQHRRISLEQGRCAWRVECGAAVDARDTQE